MEQCHSMNFILYMMGKKLEQKLHEDVSTWSLFCLLKMRWGYIKERGIAIDVVFYTCSNNYIFIFYTFFVFYSQGPQDASITGFG